MSADAELVVFSHLRWPWVWQRPHHIVSRLAQGRRTLFVEEPIGTTEVDEPTLRSEPHGSVERVWLEVPDAENAWPGFDHPDATHYGPLLRDQLGDADRVVWLYTPLALPMAQALDPDVLIYDVMDDLASFKDASPLLRRLQDQTLTEAQLVLAGGRSLHDGIKDRADGKSFLFASGVAPEHFQAARSRRRERQRPVAGYVGVIDERVDLALVGELAERLPDWDLVMVGPVTKIDPAAVPQAPNLSYPGLQPYEALPEILGGFDIALMPFQLNEATRSISPTKTLEYLAAGLPVVSTRVPDVVAGYRGVVAFADDAEGFAAACRRTREDGQAERDAKVQPLLHIHHWDTIAARMDHLMVQALAGEPFDDQIPLRADHGGAARKEPAA
ncbi:MAG TPA: glycosyltransferase [Thermoleophilaceae bacterium]|nr:glycosyltransferase [Thermoleophilaceae bacterium]